MLPSQTRTHRSAQWTVNMSLLLRHVDDGDYPHININTNWSARKALVAHAPPFRHSRGASCLASEYNPRGARRSGDPLLVRHPACARPILSRPSRARQARRSKLCVSLFGAVVVHPTSLCTSRSALSRPPPTLLCRPCVLCGGTISTELCLFGSNKYPTVSCLVQAYGM